jgi:aspartate racemase
VHIATATGARIRADGLACVGLLGTRPTMERDFYRARLAAMGITALVPDEDGRRYVDRAIYDEMVKNRFLPETRAAFLAIIDDLRLQGAQAVVLGCTEIPLLIRPEDCPLPLYDTTAIHAAAGVEFMIG